MTTGACFPMTASPLSATHEWTNPMLRVTVELVPFGDGEPRQIGCAIVGGTESRDDGRHDYVAIVWDDWQLRAPAVVSVAHSRKLGVWELVRKVAASALTGDLDAEVQPRLMGLLQQHLDAARSEDA